MDEIVDLVNWRKVHQMLHAHSIVTLYHCGGREREREREREAYYTCMYMYMYMYSY